MMKQTMYLVTSPQGGTGKSTIAVNLAIHYAKQDYKVLLIDLAIYGSLPSMLKIPIRGKGMSSLITALEQNNDLEHFDQFPQYFRESLIPYQDQKNLHLLLSASPLKMENLSARQTAFLLQTARKENYNIIIIDTSSELCQRNIASIENADFILIPTLQDVTSGWKVILFKEILDNLNISRENVGLLVNRCTKYSAFNNQEFQNETGYPIVGEINDLSKIIQKFVNMGIPIENCGKKKAAVPFQKLAEQMLKRVGS
mgnify:CR=1 FL=1